ncbi:MAG: endonuclease III [archaeon]|nr:endonuclease III [archaeon]MCP8313564.1 endonuclease III [archaeon]
MMEIGFLIKEIRKMLQDMLGSETALGEISKSRRSDPFKVLIATILSHRTRDENTSRAFQQLFSTYKDVKEIAEGDENTIQELIKPAGFHRVKAGRIKEVSKIIIDRYNGKVPDDLEKLLSLPSVGRKTANCVLVYGFGKEAIPVDTHVHRIVNRLGLVNTKTPEETEFELMKKVDKKYWIDINELFVRFGQKICRPIIPRCNACRLRSYCKWYQEFGKRIYEKEG